jgi:uncharacterized protein YcaQ
VKSLVLEPGVRTSERFTRDVNGALQRLADWHECPQVKITQKEAA